MANKNSISKDSVLNDDALTVDIASDEVEVIASDISVANQTVTNVAVIKNTAEDKPEADNADQENDKTNVFDERIAQVLGLDEEEQDNIKDKADEVKEAVTDTVQNAKDKVADTKEAVQDKVAEVKDTIEDKVDNAKEVVQDKLDDAKEMMADAKDTALDKAQDLQQTAQEKAEEIKDTVQDKVEDAKEVMADAKEAIQDKKEQLSQKADGIKEELSQKVQDIKEKAADTADTLKQTLSDKIDGVKEAFKGEQNSTDDTTKVSKDDEASLKDKAGEVLTGLKDKAQSLLSDTKEKFNDTKDKLSDTLSDTKDKLSQETAAIQDKLDDAKEDLQKTKENLLDKKDALVEQAMQTHDEAKQEAAAYESSHTQSGLKAKLGAMGAYLGAFYAPKDSYEAADLDSPNDGFYAQTGAFAQNLLGSKGQMAGSLAKKFLSEDKLDSISKAVYGKIASWAQDWALADLKNDERFESLADLSDDEKEAFADDIVNQNRALATMGAVAGLMGLKGVVADTAWLLLVSLKSVYQLAHLYGKRLSGKEGIEAAYGILSQCNLDGLQEKQVIMTALALGNTVLVNAQSTSLSDELKKLTDKYQSRGFDELSKFVNLDKFNVGILHWLLPVGGAAVAAHYNNELINEVLGVARATFAKQPVSGLLEDKTKDETKA